MFNIQKETQRILQFILLGTDNRFDIVICLLISIHFFFLPKNDFKLKSLII